MNSIPKKKGSKIFKKFPTILIIARSLYFVNGSVAFLMYPKEAVSNANFRVFETASSGYIFFIALIWLRRWDLNREGLSAIRRSTRRMTQYAAAATAT